MVTFSHQKRILQEEIKRRAGVFVHQLAGIGKEGLMTKDDLSVFSTIKDIQKHAGVVYAMVVDTNGASLCITPWRKRERFFPALWIKIP
jgi:hypothetical protein